MFGREIKRAEEIKNYYELCFEDFQRRTHESIKSISKENRELKERIKKAQEFIRNEPYLSDAEIDELCEILEGDN